MYSRIVSLFSAVMVPKHLMKLYIDCCEELSESPNLEVVRKLYALDVSFKLIVPRILLDELLYGLNIAQ